MKKTILLISLLAIFVSPVFAAGNLTVSSTNIAPAYINTRTLTNMLNISLNATGGDVNISTINVTIGGSAAIGNVSVVAVVNSTGSVIASNSTNLTGSKFIIYFNGGLNATLQRNTSIIIAINISSAATLRSNISVKINNIEDFGIDSNSNVTFLTFTNSTESQVQDFHANASISPRIVDTFVINQSFVYTLIPTGLNKLQNITIGIPSGYFGINVTSVSHGGSTIYNSTFQDGALVLGFSQDRIDVNYSSGFSQAAVVVFTANTSSSTSGVFSSVISGDSNSGNLSNVNTDPVNGDQTNVTTKQLLNVTNIGAMKTVALLNGSDYWEFNLTINVTSAVSGLLQFKMSNWNRTDSTDSIQLTNGSDYYATLRNGSDFSASTKLNVTNNYDNTRGLPVSTASSSIITVFLRMVIPQGTGVSPNWYTTYSMVFRSS